MGNIGVSNNSKVKAGHVLQNVGNFYSVTKPSIVRKHRNLSTFDTLKL